MTRQDMEATLRAESTSLGDQVLLTQGESAFLDYLISEDFIKRKDGERILTFIYERATSLAAASLCSHRAVRRRVCPKPWARIRLHA